MNYLEELAYWYFRFNGYFLLQNYVNHKNNKGLKYTYETDFLGIRFPYVSEYIGGNNEDYNPEIISNTKIMCVMGESKAGQYRKSDIFKEQNKIKDNLLRFGILSSNDIIDNAVENLFLHHTWENENFKIIKVLIAEKETHNDKYIFISKNKIINEIYRRKGIYRKNQDKLFFSSNLVQYLFS